VPSPFTAGFVKICGVTSVADATAVAESGASAIGVNLAVSSPRLVSRGQAGEIVAAIEGAVLRVAVFQGRSDNEVLEALEGIPFDAVQLHDGLSPALHDALRARSLLIIKALSIESDEFQEFDETRVDAVLVDGPRPGSGVMHSWTPLEDRRFRVPVIAAGGLTPDNVADVIGSTVVLGVDCASGVEREARTKDNDLVVSFVTNAREAFASREE
jgi:phosphoribosylanthranilate isomerase